MNRLRRLCMLLALFLVGVLIGLGYVHVSQPEAGQAAIAPAPTTQARPSPMQSHTASDTVQGAALVTNGADAANSIDGPASMAFAKPAH